MSDTHDVQVPDITPDDFLADEQESPKAAPSAVKEEAKAEPEKPAAEKETEAEKPETKETETEVAEQKADVETETEKPQGKADERKQQLNTEIRDLVAQRNTLKAEVEKANAEVYQVATESELTEQGMSEIEAKVEAMRQEREMEKFNTQVAEAQLTIGHESNRVLQDFPIFNPDDKENFDPELAAEAAELLDANLIRDPNSNQIIGSNVSPYQLYKTLARASTVSMVKGQQQGQKDTETMLANADTASAAAPPAKKADPLADLWSEPL